MAPVVISCPVPVPWSTIPWLSLQPPILWPEDPRDAELSPAFLFPCCCLLALWLSPHSHQDSGDQPLLLCGWSCAVTVQGCGVLGIEVLRAAELLRLCDAAAGAWGVEISPLGQPGVAWQRGCSPGLTV